jgi:hypothetical protein
MTNEQIDVVVTRLSELYAAATAAAEQEALGEEPRAVDFTEWAAAGGPPSRIEAVIDAATGLEYAARCIGETLAAVGGMRLVHRVFDAFESRHDSRASSWLDHRWNGVQDGDGGVWVS